MVSRLAAVSSFAAISIVVACGSSSEDDLYTKKPGTGGTDASLGGSAGTSGASSGGGAGLAGNSGVAGQDASVTGGSAGAGGEDAGKPDASGGNGGTNPVGTGACGEMTCAFVADDFCCQPNNAKPYCANEVVGNDCTCEGFCNTVDIHCDGPEDCDNGEICCADTGLTGGQYNVVECRQTCEQPFPVGGPQWEVCHLGGAPCKKGSCAADSGLPAGYGTCK